LRTTCFVEPQIGSEYFPGRESIKASAGTVKVRQRGMVSRR
jgi:hypothetical protein